MPVPLPRDPQSDLGCTDSCRPFLSITSGLDYEMQALLQSRIHEALALLSVAGRNIRPGERVALKINLAVPALPEAAVGTHPEILRAAIKVLQETQAEVLVVEDCDEAALSVSGVAAVVAECGVPFLNLRDFPYQNVISGSHTYAYSQQLLEVDHLISLPKLKTHLYTYYTGAIKNMYGCILKSQRKALHADMSTALFSEHLVNIFAVRPPDLVIMDGILAMEGIGPTQGTPKNAGLLLISNDAVLLDRCGAALMGYDPDQIEMISIAVRQGLQRCLPEQVFFPHQTMSDLPRQGWNHLPVLREARRKRTLQTLCGPIEASTETCICCGICEANCPFGAIRLAPYPEVDSALCQYCFCCLELCPEMAMHITGFQHQKKRVAYG